MKYNAGALRVFLPWSRGMHDLRLGFPLQLLNYAKIVDPSFGSWLYFWLQQSVGTRDRPFLLCFLLDCVARGDKIGCGAAEARGVCRRIGYRLRPS